jgi:hypothetical protein
VAAPVRLPVAAIAAKIRRSSQLGLISFINEIILFDVGHTHAFMKVVDLLMPIGKRRNR